jgi:hypothetical protein
MNKNVVTSLFLTALFIIGCGHTNKAPDIGVKYFELTEADHDTYSIVLGRFPRQSVGKSTTYWAIYKKDSDKPVSLMYKGQHAFGRNSHNIIYGLNRWTDEGYYAILIPEGEYKFQFSFPSGTGYAVKHNKVFKKDLFVTPGKIIYMGSYNPVIETKMTTSGSVTTTQSYYIGMEAKDRYEEDINIFREKFPSIFSDNKYGIENVTN